MLSNIRKEEVSTLYLLECGFWISAKTAKSINSFSFNPLFVGVWLLNDYLRLFPIRSRCVSTLYLLECGFWMTPEGLCFRYEDCFNPLFVGVWLLNEALKDELAKHEEFQPFICWSVAFEFKECQWLHIPCRVSTLYLLECGFWISAKTAKSINSFSFNPLFVGVWLLNTP